MAAVVLGHSDDDTAPVAARRKHEPEARVAGLAHHDERAVATLDHSFTAVQRGPDGTVSHPDAHSRSGSMAETRGSALSMCPSGLSSYSRPKQSAR